MWAQTVTLHQVSSMFSKLFVWNTAENSLPRSETLSASKTADNFFFLQNNQVRGVLPLKSLRAHPASQNHFGESAGCWALIIVLLQPVELSVRCICQTWHGSIFMNPAALHRSQSGAPCPVHCGFAKLSFGMFVARIHCWHRHAEFQKWNTLPRVFKCGTFFLFEFFKNELGFILFFLNNSSFSGNTTIKFPFHHNGDHSHIYLLCDQKCRAPGATLARLVTKKDDARTCCRGYLLFWMKTSGGRIGRKGRPWESLLWNF